MVALSVCSAQSINDLNISKLTRDVSLRTSAIDFLVDFSRVRPVIVDADSPAVDVLNLAMFTPYSLPILVKKGGVFSGILNADDITERKIIQKVSKGCGRRDVCVADLMCAKASLSVLNYDEVSQSSIAEVIKILKNVGHRQCLVADETSQDIRGIFSANDVCARLNIDLGTRDPVNFYRIFLAVTKKDSALE